MVVWYVSVGRRLGGVLRLWWCGMFQSDVGWEEYYDYIFPDDQSVQPNLKLLAMAKQWKTTGARDDDDDNPDRDDSNSSSSDSSSDDDDDGDEDKDVDTTEQQNKRKRSDDDSDSGVD